MNIYFDETQAVSDEILRKMEEAAAYGADLENLDDERCEIASPSLIWKKSMSLINSTGE